VFALTLLFVAGIANVGSGQSAPQWQIGLSTFVSQGDYGTDDTTRLVYTTFSLRRSFTRGDVTLRLPWLDVRSDSTVVIFQGTAQPTRRGERTPAPISVRTATHERGLADISIGGRYFLVDDGRRQPAVDLTARLDLPTGDASRGLGLGAASVEVGVEVTKGFGPLLGLGAVSFTAAGQPETVAIQNPWEYSAGLGVYVVAPVLLSVSFEQWRSVIPGSPVGRDVLAAATIAAGRSLRILASAQFPLSQQAPDFGAGAGLALRF
jgi:hypothetical protein